MIKTIERIIEITEQEHKVHLVTRWGHGAQGTTGATGAQGATGATGAQGATGATGAQGLPGTDGENGAQGPRGFNGTDGVNGIQGSPGITFVNGTNVYLNQSQATSQPGQFATVYANAKCDPTDFVLNGGYSITITGGRVLQVHFDRPFVGQEPQIGSPPGLGWEDFSIIRIPDLAIPPSCS